MKLYGDPKRTHPTLRIAKCNKCGYERQFTHLTLSVNCPCGAGYRIVQPENGPIPLTHETEPSTVTA